MNFLDTQAEYFKIAKTSLAYQYLERKTRASNRGSKARRSLGNLYALYVLCEDYINHSTGSTFSNLMARMKSLPFGSKLQNHPLDNRLNDEVKRTFQIEDNSLLPVQNIFIGQQKSRKISEHFLNHHNLSAQNTAQFIINSINQYIQIINDNQTYFLDQIENLDNKDDFLNLISETFEPQSDARLFEIISFAILHIHFRKTEITINHNNLIQHTHLTLYRTGRTNANDGGIDFVLTPLGKFYQVTEVLDFKKYFLDFEKVNRFPISFVVKSNLSSKQVRTYIIDQANSQYLPTIVDRYMQLFDEIYTNIDLKNMLNLIAENENQMAHLKDIICTQFKLEYGLLD